MNIKLNLLADYLVENIYNDSAPYVRSQYKKLIAERDTSDVWRQFAIWLLVDPDHGVIRFTKPGSKQYQAIQDVARLYDENCKDRSAWDKAAKDAAWADAKSAEAAAQCAVLTDRDAPYSPATAAWAARAAAHATARAANAAHATAWAAWAAAHAARLSFYKHMAEKLLELLQLAPPKEAP